MAVTTIPVPAVSDQLHDRLKRTVELIERRGYALEPAALGSACLGGPVAADLVLEWLAASDHVIASGLVVSRAAAPRAESIRARQAAHRDAAAGYLGQAVTFARRLASLFPFVISVSIAGSLASGGFRESDDVDLNLVVEDGRRHLAYLALNLLGFLHALRRRGKPVDAHTARPFAPRVMTANLILERSQCFPLLRQDEDMAYELFAARPIVGTPFVGLLVAGNPGLTEHFPQLAAEAVGDQPAVASRVPLWLFPAFLDRPARWLGAAGWRYMQWTRRERPEALERVAFVRSTMKPYALFDDSRC